MDAAAKMIGNKIKIMGIDVATIVAAVWEGDSLVCTLKAEPEYEGKLTDIGFPDTISLPVTYEKRPDMLWVRQHRQPKT